MDCDVWDGDAELTCKKERWLRGMQQCSLACY